MVVEDVVSASAIQQRILEVAQAEQIKADRANIVFMTHASLFSTPPRGARLPHPVGLVVDEEPVLGSGLAVERRVMGKLYGLGLGADEITVVRQRIETHAISPRRDIIEMLEGPIEETETQQQTRWWDLGSREDRTRRARTTRIWIESTLNRRALRQAQQTADTLGRMEAWIRSRTAPDR